jgi:hypothetical protein
MKLAPLDISEDRPITHPDRLGEIKDRLWRGAPFDEGEINEIMEALEKSVDKDKTKD